MASASASLENPPSQADSVDVALVDTVDSRTHRQVQNLQIDCQDERVVVTGDCKSYYVKQLVTHAVLAACPFVKLENRVRVCVA